MSFTTDPRRRRWRRRLACTAPSSARALRTPWPSGLIFFIALAGLSPGGAASHPLNIAHRGGTIVAPENTLVNYQAGLDNGADWIEIDVWKSSDGVLVCHHDATLDRTTNGTGFVYEHSLAELRALDAGSWFAPEFAGEQIPTLEEALDLVTPQGIAYLDIKRVEYIPAIASLVDSLGIPQDRIVAWIRLGTTMAADYKTHLPDSRLVLGAGHWYSTDEKLLWERAEAGDYGVAPRYQTLNAEFVDLAHSYGLTVLPFTVVSTYYSSIMAMGVDGLVVAAPEFLDLLLPGPQPQCSDGVDNDNDGSTDYPFDPGCFGPEGALELTPCSDGADNDGDGWTDHPADPGCYAPFSLDESPQCDDGIDNDGSGQVDHPADPGCFAAFDSREATQCRDGLDNDENGLADYPDDPGCDSAADNFEGRECDDGVDNDGDGQIDFRDDPGCLSRHDPSEQTECEDGIDNDADGLVDDEDGGCANSGDHSELPDCADGLDNDRDGKTDVGFDPGCLDASDPFEYGDCEDGIDNDLDGLVDDEDGGCTSSDDHTELPDCWDGVDNDGDGALDWPADPGCAARNSPTEEPACDDDTDNDGDGERDFPNDPECADPWSVSENPACQDGQDNDGDNLFDFPYDPQCRSALDASEGPDCSDGIDNDGDGLIDYPDDPSCRSESWPAERFFVPRVPALAPTATAILVLSLLGGGLAGARCDAARRPQGDHVPRRSARRLHRHA